MTATVRCCAAALALWAASFTSSAAAAGGLGYSSAPGYVIAYR